MSGALTIRAHMLVTLAAFLAWTSSAVAQQPRRGADIYTGPCVSELHAYCANVLEGQGRQLNCLAAYAQSLTPACRARLVQRGALAPLVPVPAPAVVSAPTTIVVEAPPAPERPRYTPQVVHQRPAPQAKPRPAPAAPVAAAASAAAATPTSQAAVATVMPAPAAASSAPVAAAVAAPAASQVSIATTAAVPTPAPEPVLLSAAPTAGTPSTVTQEINITIRQRLDQLPKTERSEDWLPWLSKIPVQEDQFCKVMQKFRADFRDAKERRNEIQESAAYLRMRQDLANLLPNGEFKDWIVRAQNVKSASDGSAAVIFQPLCDVLIGSYACGPDPANFKGTIPEREPLYREAAKLGYRDFVVVSGNFPAVNEPAPGLSLIAYRYFPAGSLCTEEEATKKQDLLVAQLNSIFKMVLNAPR